LVVFLKIDTYHMRWWDESMFAVNTYEMIQNGKYFSQTFYDAPDLINTKPPLTTWLQILFVKVLGYNEVAIRLPSAIAAALTILLLFLFVYRRFGVVLAWLSSLVLLTSPGFIGFHTARTGDSDSLLTFFLFIANIYFLKSITEQKLKSILIFFLFITLAFCTKTYAAFLFIPAYIIILIIRKKFKWFISNRYFFGGLILLLVGGILIMYLRELGTPGYIEKTIIYDLGKLHNGFEKHTGDWDYYLDNLNLTRFSMWFIIALIGIIFSFMKRNDEKESVFFDLTILVVCYFVLVSLSSTKLLWYDMPVYPFLSILAAFGLYKGFENRINVATLNKDTLLFILVIFSIPYWMMFRRSQSNIIPNGEKKNEAAERFLFQRSNEKSNLDGIKVYYYGWNGSLLFYKYKFAEKGETLELTRTFDFKPNDRILVSNDSLFIQIMAKHKFKILERNDYGRLVQIIQ
jgi:4-amino-4-deoxy-L-arabinose transferase-like glycosyltransferase